MDRPELAIVIPALNEAATIGPVVKAATAFGQVFVVDDGSGDGTGDVARAAGAVVVRHETSCGYEASLGDGCAAASESGAKAVVTMDADGEHDPALLGEFRRLLIDEDVPLVLGVRPRRQRLAESIMGLLFRWRYGVSDALCGMKGYHLDLYRQNGGFDHVGGVGTELAVQSIRRGTRFHEIPVSGNRRVDRPRFGRALQSNLRIVCSLSRVMRLDAAKGQ
ncbi:glycosyltransferase [Alphaproteobacteria bacterium HT1-32]|nr:glycosyltransferase [Alphaproteobacteria bacterium HT1-32]